MWKSHTKATDITNLQKFKKKFSREINYYYCESSVCAFFECEEFLPKAKIFLILCCFGGGGKEEEEEVEEDCHHYHYDGNDNFLNIKFGKLILILNLFLAKLKGIVCLMSHLSIT